MILLVSGNKHTFIIRYNEIMQSSMMLISTSNLIIMICLLSDENNIFYECYKEITTNEKT